MRIHTFSRAGSTVSPANKMHKPSSKRITTSQSYPTPLEHTEAIYINPPFNFSHTFNYRATTRYRHKSQMTHAIKWCERGVLSKVTHDRANNTKENINGYSARLFTRISIYDSWPRKVHALRYRVYPTQSANLSFCFLQTHQYPKPRQVSLIFSATLGILENERRIHRFHRKNCPQVIIGGFYCGANMEKAIYIVRTNETSNLQS